jgi:hypothetical protein
MQWRTFLSAPLGVDGFASQAPPADAKLEFEPLSGELDSSGCAVGSTAEAGFGDTTQFPGAGLIWETSRCLLGIDPRPVDFRTGVDQNFHIVLIFPDFASVAL